MAQLRALLVAFAVAVHPDYVNGCSGIPGVLALNCTGRGLNGPLQRNMPLVDFAACPAVSGGHYTLLDYSWNQITTIGPSCFHNVSTMTLDLAFNSLTTLQVGVFDGLLVMNTLNASHNQLTQIEPGAFEDIRLVHLDLSHNYVHRLTPLAFRGLSASLMDLSQNDVMTVLAGTWNDTDISLLAMADNPTVCSVQQDDDILCQCAGMEVEDSLQEECILCPRNQIIPNVRMLSVVSVLSSTATTSSSGTTSTTTATVLASTSTTTFIPVLTTEPSRLAEYQVEDVATSMPLNCSMGPLGSICLFECTNGFLGVPVTYQCAETGVWVPDGNLTAPACLELSPYYIVNATEAEQNTTNTSLSAERLLYYSATLSATVGEAYFYPPPQAYGRQLDFSVNEMPPGLSMDHQGQILGIPTASGRFTFTVMVHDSATGTGVSATRMVMDIAPPLLYLDTRVVYAIKNHYMVYGEAMIVRGGRRPFQFYYDGELPPGITLNQYGDRPQVSGIPSEIGIWSNIVIRVVDAGGVVQQFPKIEIRVKEEDNIMSFRDQFFISLGLSLMLILVSLFWIHRTRQVGQSDSVIKKQFSYMAEKAENKQILNERAQTETILHFDIIPESDFEGKDLCTTATRIYRPNRAVPLDSSVLVPLDIFVRKAVRYSKRILIAAPQNDRPLCEGIELMITQLGADSLPTVSIELIKVPFWGRFTPPLNVLLRTCSSSNDRVLLFQSIEMLLEVEAVVELVSQMDESTLVTGLALDHSHRFQTGKHELGGLTAPWNTCAMWNVKTLACIGFLPVSDGTPPLSPEDAGVEEVAVIALLQMLFPAKAEAKLLRIASKYYSWDINFKCEERLTKHIRKLHSKSIRPMSQLKALGTITPGHVLHIDCTDTECTHEEPTVDANRNILHESDFEGDIIIPNFTFPASLEI